MELHNKEENTIIFINTIGLINKYINIFTPINILFGDLKVSIYKKLLHSYFIDRFH